MKNKPERLSVAEVKLVAEKEGISLVEARDLIKWRLRNSEANEQREAWNQRVQSQEDMARARADSVKQQQNKLREELGVPPLP